MQYCYQNLHMHPDVYEPFLKILQGQVRSIQIIDKLMSKIERVEHPKL